jgi:hypothetical protein
MPRIVKTSDTFFSYSIKKGIDKQKTGYVYVLDDGIPTGNGEVGMSGSRSSPCNASPPLRSTWRAQRPQPVNYGIVVNNLSFNFVQLLSAALHDTLGSYHRRDALQEGSVDALACLPTLRAYSFSLLSSFYLVIPTAFSCRKTFIN